MQLRGFQKDTVLKIKNKLTTGVTRQIVQYATGLGKTPLFSALPDELGFTKRMMVVVHREQLNVQALDKLKVWNPGRTVGVEMGDWNSNGEQLVVAGNATIGRKNSPRLLKFDPNDFDCLVIDECHHATSQSYRTIVDHFTQNKSLLVLGVTATPNRADGTGLGQVFQELVDTKDILYGINHGWLSDLRGIRIKTGVSLNEVHNVAGDFAQGELGATVNTPARNRLIAESWKEHAAGRQTVIFSVNIQHAIDIATVFKEQGIDSEAVWGDDPDRALKLTRHREGKITVLVNCQLLTEGYDDWKVSCIGVARPTQSEGLYTQMIGRGTRIPDGIGNLRNARHAGLKIEKDDCLILDWVDATSKHSLVTMPTLFGMTSNMDLHGKAISAVVAEIAQVKQKNPLLDLTKIDDIDKLQSYAEQVDFFKVSFPDGIQTISENQWHRTADNMYILSLPHREGLVVAKDILDTWHIVGDVNECNVNDTRPSFAEAIQEADFKVERLGGKALSELVKRERAWHREEPTPKQLSTCKRFNIVVPPGATKGQVSMTLSKMFHDLWARDRARRACSEDDART
jgi:superfamily II DNA or RNA helicase